MSTDYRETFFQSVKNALIGQGMDPDIINQVTNTVMICSDPFEITARCTELAKVDTATEQLIKLYIGTILTEGKSKKTAYGYQRILKRLYRDVSKPLMDVNVFDIRLWLAKMQQEVSLTTCENYRSYIAAFYQWLQREEILEKNPTAKILPIKFTEEIKLEFSEIEIDALRSACQTLRERAILELLLSSGARVSEMCAMDISDIDMASKSVLIREGKGGKQRKTYITDVCRLHLQKYLESRKDDNPALIITKYGKRITKASAEKELHRIGSRAGVHNVHPHRCRRTFATSLARKGMDIRTIQALMGHSNINTTMRYINLSHDHTKNEYQRYA